jgi:hypothetical protein
MRRAAGWAALVVVLAATQASAGHMPYLEPKTFGPRRDVVTVEAAMAEEATLFVPDFTIRGSGDYVVTDPSGATKKIEGVTTLKELAIFEAPTPADGTYRITSGERAGRSGKLAKIDGVWRNVRPTGGAPRPPENGAPPPANGPIDEAQIPAGAEAMTTQSYLKADVYVSRGAPTATALKPTGQGLEIAPLTHPNEAFAGEAFKFRLLVDGQPLAHAPFTVSKAREGYEPQRFTTGGAAGADGAAQVTLAKPGIYVIQVQNPVRVEGQPPVPAAKSLTTTLTFEVTR